VDEQVRSRAEEIVAGLSVDQCLSLVGGKDFWTTQPIDGVVPSVMMTDGPHGLRKQIGDTDHVGLNDSVPSTCFPVATVLASTWDLDLVREVGTALGVEAREEDVALLLGPGLNIKRHPRGGRNFEYVSEDPLLSGAVAAALVQGVQSQGVGACLKHYAVNNQETMRMVVDAVVDERTLREIYLRGFEIAVERSSPAAVMTSYNRVNGVHASDHAHLLRDILRDDWGFDGLVVSDWGGTNDRVLALEAGMDLEMPSSGGAYDDEVRAALADGSLPESRLRESAARVVELALRGDALRAEPTTVDHAAHHALARRAAAAGTVLLTNDGILPLADADGLAVIGAYADDPRYQGGGSSRVSPTRVDSLRSSLPPETPYAPGYDPRTGQSTVAEVAEAVVLASRAEVVVLVVGFPAGDEIEARDRPADHLPDSMQDLVRAVCAANARTVVVVQNGGTLELPWADVPAALVEAYLGGQASGSALADVLFGTTEPGGRLAESLPVSIAALPSDANFPGEPRQVQYRETQWVGYRFHETYDVPARFAFGHGLGYTTWDLADLTVAADGAAATVRVTNTGQREGSTAVQVYVHAESSPVPRPAKELAGFVRVRAAAGETVEVTVPIERRLYSVWDTASGRWMVDGGDYSVLAGFSSADVRATATATIASSDVVTPVPATAGPVATEAEFARLLGHPVPAAEKTRPFSRISTISEVDSTVLGSVLARVVKREMEKMIPADDDGSNRDLFEGSTAGLPLRALAAMGGGAMSLATVDRIIAGLNRNWVKAVRGR
jgi:beta-glucosidase